MHENRKYPTERKMAPTWECPICQKTMSSRGKIGHMEKVHGRGKPIYENSPRWWPDIIVSKKRPPARADLRKLLAYVNMLLFTCNESNDIILKRTRLLQCEYLFKEFEMKFNCTLEEVKNKFPELALKVNEVTLTKDINFL